MKLLVTDSKGVLIGRISSKAIDASNARALKDAVKPLLAGPAQIVLDLSTIDFIDSSGLAALVSCLRQAHATGGEIKLSGLTKPARALFELVRMHRVFEVFNDSDEAVSSYQHLNS